jgi:predicted metal-dependent peptidase
MILNQSQKPRSPALTEAISALLVQQPFFASLVLDLLKIEEATSIPGSADPLRTAATDGQTLWVNPEKFNRLNIHERVAMLSHEVMHVILQHNTRLRMYMALGVGPDLKAFSPKKFNSACDYIINAYLVKAGFKLPLGSLQNSQVTENDIVDEVYLKLPDEEDDQDQPEGIDNHVEGDPQTAPAKATVQAAMKKAEEISKMQGKGTGMHKRLIDDICETQVPWHEVLRKAMTTVTRGREAYTWSRPNRRKLAVAPHIYWPGRAGWKGPHIAVEIDTSGSISDAEISVFLGELAGILTDLEPEMMYVMYVDDKLHGDVIEIDDVNQLQNVREKSGGGGGTDMTVVFDEIKQRELPVETVVVFTDGYTPFGEEAEAGIPTVWCITTDKQAPWGTTVNVKIPKQS